MLTSGEIIYIDNNPNNSNNSYLDGVCLLHDHLAKDLLIVVFHQNYRKQISLDLILLYCQLDKHFYFIDMRGSRISVKMIA